MSGGTLQVSSVKKRKLKNKTSVGSLRDALQCCENCGKQGLEDGNRGRKDVCRLGSTTMVLTKITPIKTADNIVSTELRNQQSKASKG